MRKRTLFQRITAATVSALMCCTFLPLTTFAADLPLYGITADTDTTITELSVLEENTLAFERISEEAALLNYGAIFESDSYYNLTIDPGHPVSAFSMKASSSDGTVSFTMDKPTELGFDSGLLELLGEAYMIAVQDASDPDSPVMFYPAEMQENNLHIKIPEWDNGVNCALLYYADSELAPRSFTAETSNISFPSSVFENSQGSVLPFKWAVTMKSQEIADHLLPNMLYGKILLKPSSGLTIDADSVEVTSDFLKVTHTDKASDGSLLVELEATEEFQNTANVSEQYELFNTAIEISCNAVVKEGFFKSEESISVPYAQFSIWSDEYEHLSGHYMRVAGSAIADFGAATMKSAVTIKPANMTIYQGGDEGYEGVYDDGQPMGSDSLPHPLFEITPASGSSVDPEELTFTNGGKSWKVVGTGDPNLYYFEPVGEHRDPVRVTYTDQDGNSVTNDEFKVENVGNTYAEYAIDLYPGENDLSEVKATAGKEEWSISVNSGTLTVRAVETADPTSDIVANAPTSAVEENKAVAVAPADTTYTLNDTGVQIPKVASDDNPDGSKPSLLFDEIITSDGVDRIDALKDAVDTKLGTTNGTRHYVAKYLDLVDANNGNAWISSSAGTDIYWGYPATTDKNTNFTLVHFRDLHRDGTESGFDIDDINSDNVDVLTTKDGKIVNTDYGIKFHVAKGGFSPFVLVWETEAEKPGPDPNPGGGGDSHSDPTGNLTISLGGNGGNEDFIFTVIFTDEDGDELENNFYYNGDYTGTIGSGDEITLTGGDKIVIRNLPEGTRYEVIIETADGYTATSTGAEGVIRTSGNEAAFSVTPTVVLADPSVTGVTRWLNTTDHTAYLSGYPGGTFGPDNSMTRAEVAQMFYALLLNKDVTITKTFSDVPADAWYATAVNTLASLGMVSGDPDGTFRPNDPITRAEFCVIALAFAYEPDNAVCYFGDVSRSDWFYTYVAQAASYGWIGGYTNGNFGPNDQITRAQVTTIVNNMLGRAADRDYVIDHQADLVQFTDLTRAHWGYFQIMEATNAHNYTKSNGTESWR